MKQLALDEIIEALSDKPAQVGDRLAALGVEEEVSSKFSAEVLSTTVYGSSFLKFLQDNKSKLGESAKIPAEAIPEDFVNAFDEGEMTLEDRLVATGFPKENLDEMFHEDVLKLALNGDEFQNFIETNRDKFVGGIQKLAGVTA